MEGNKYLLIATLMTLALLIVSACKTKHTYTTPDGTQIELPHTPADKEGGAR